MPVARAHVPPIAPEICGDLMQPIYAVGDIHGQNTMLEDTLALIEKDGGTDAPIVFLGDYVDRGPDSRAVVETLAQGLQAGRNWVCLKGNHDRMFEGYLETPPRHDPYMLVGMHWFSPKIGGAQTLAAYGITEIEGRRLFELGGEILAKVPPHHAAFLRGLQLCHHTEGLFFVHAGIRPGVPLGQQSETDMLWIREVFHTDTRDHGALVVHGHTPVDQATHYGNRINLDSGAGYGRPISAAVFENGQVWQLTPQGRQPLPQAAPGSA